MGMGGGECRESPAPFGLPAGAGIRGRAVGRLPGIRRIDDDPAQGAEIDLGEGGAGNGEDRHPGRGGERREIGEARLGEQARHDESEHQIVLRCGPTGEHEVVPGVEDEAAERGAELADAEDADGDGSGCGGHIRDNRAPGRGIPE